MAIVQQHPCRADGVEMHAVDDGPGRRRPVSGYMVLHAPARRVYFRLDRLGRFVWERLDGRADLTALTRAYYEAHGVFAPAAIASLLEALAVAGMVRGLPAQPPPPPSTLERIHGWLTGTWHLHGCDAFFAALDRGLGGVLARPAAAAIATGLAIAGSWLCLGGNLDTARFDRMGWAELALFVGMHLMAMVLHELAHGLVAKRFGRRIDSVGVGWLYVTPRFFVDTSDMWLAPRRARVAVSLAGPLTHAGLGGVVALVAWSCALPPPLAAAASLFAPTSLTLAVANLNPLLELDGYHVLVDTLDRPNLRRDAFRWLRCHAISDAAAGRLRARYVELSFSLLAVSYLLAVAVLVGTVGRRALLRHLADHVAPATAMTIATLLAAMVVATLVAGLVGEFLRADPSSSASTSRPGTSGVLTSSTRSALRGPPSPPHIRRSACRSRRRFRLGRRS
jgi:putative peptide zinc metalloprotease protein